MTKLQMAKLDYCLAEAAKLACALPTAMYLASWLAGKLPDRLHTLIQSGAPESAWIWTFFIHGPKNLGFMLLILATLSLLFLFATHAKDMETKLAHEMKDATNTA